MSSIVPESAIAGDMVGAEPGGRWRWTNQHPRFRLALDPGVQWEFYSRFRAPAVVLGKVGPLRLSFTVNDEIIGTGRYTQDGLNEFTHRLEPDLLRKHSPVVFGIDIDPVYIADDGAKLGVLLEAIGFREAAK